MFTIDPPNLKLFAVDLLPCEICVSVLAYCGFFCVLTVIWSLANLVHWQYAYMAVGCRHIQLATVGRRQRSRYGEYRLRAWRRVADNAGIRRLSWVFTWHHWSTFDPAVTCRVLVSPLTQIVYSRPSWCQRHCSGFPQLCTCCTNRRIPTRFAATIRVRSVASCPASIYHTTLFPQIHGRD